MLKSRANHERALGAWIPCALILLIALFSTKARAEAPTPVRIEYSTDGVCPDKQRFTRELLARTPELRLAEAGEEALRFSVDLSVPNHDKSAPEHTKPISGRVLVKEPSGHETIREVAGLTCDEVIAALALIASVLVEPEPRAKPKPKPKTGFEEGFPLPQARPEPDVPETRDFRMRAGVGIAFDNAWSPSPMAGLSAAFEIDSERPGSPQPLIFFLLHYARTPLTGLPVDYEWFALRTGVCPFRWPTNRPLYATFCPFADIGSLHGRSTVTADTVPWVAFGAFARIEAKAFDAFTFSLDGGFAVPVNRHKFVVRIEGQSGQDAFEVPFIGVLGRLGVSVGF